MVPADLLAEIEHRETAEDHERDDLLNDLELRGRVNRIAPAIGGHLQAVFEESDAPAYENDDEQRLALELQVAVPRDGHEEVRADEQRDGKQAGLEKGVHCFDLVFFVLWRALG